MNLAETGLDYGAVSTSLHGSVDHVNSVNSPPNYQDMVLYVEMLHCKLQTGHSTKTALTEE